VEFVEVEENEKEDLPPRGLDLGANREAFRFSEANGGSKCKMQVTMQASGLLNKCRVGGL
jgi:hypothetical protein